MTLTEFLLARIAEDERAAKVFVNGLGQAAQWRADEVGGVVRKVGERAFGLPDDMATADTHMTAVHIARHDPARVLAECEAKRQIAEEHAPVEWSSWATQLDRGTPTCSSCGNSEYHAVAWPCATAKALALPYADHPDYNKAWRP